MMRAYARARLNPEDERGATIVIVVLALVAIIGMVVLTVDVGGLLLRRRAMVNAADSAALAAAQTCANNQDTQTPETVSDTYAAQNGAPITATDGGIVTSPGCHDPSATNGYVTVQYTTQQRLFFAGVLGFGNQNPVTAAATAAWGPPSSGGIMPIVLDSGELQGQCDVPDGIALHATCPFFYDSGTLGNAQWGFMNLNLWNVAAASSCNDSNQSDLKGWITDQNGQNATLNGTPPGTSPTYVCGNNGHVAGDWNKELTDQIGTIRFFPVNDCTGQLPSACPSAPDKYDIIGFTQLLIKDVITGQAAKGTAGANGSCTWTKDFIPATTTPLSSSFGTGNQCPTSLPDSVTNLTITAAGKKGAVQQPCTTITPVPAPLGCAYFYDTTQNTIRWVGLPQLGAVVTYDWSFNGTGPCGYHPSAGGNAVCLLTQWEGFSSSTGTICTTCPNFGVTNILLCDRTLATCPGQ